MGLGLMACSEEVPLSIEPEVAHCATIVGRATQVYGDITIIGVQVADLGDARTVRLRFAYPPGNEDFSVGNISCSYAFAFANRSDPKRVVRASSVYFKGRDLSENELYILNTSPFRALPKFKLNP